MHIALHFYVTRWLCVSFDVKSLTVPCHLKAAHVTTSFLADTTTSPGRFAIKKTPIEKCMSLTSFYLDLYASFKNSQFGCVEGILEHLCERFLLVGLQILVSSCRLLIFCLNHQFKNYYLFGFQQAKTPLYTIMSMYCRMIHKCSSLLSLFVDSKYSMASRWFHSEIRMWSAFQHSLYVHPIQ